MGNDQKPKCSSCIVTKPHNLKILLFLLHDYHTLQLKYIFIPAIAFSFHSIKILQTHQLEFFWISNPTGFFLEIGRNYVSIIITIIRITFGYFLSTNHDVNRKAPPMVFLTLFPYQVFTMFTCCFTRNTLSILFCSDQIIAKNNAFLK